MKFILFFFSFLLFGCISTHYDRSENFIFSWKIGDLDSAVLEAGNLAETGPKRDRLLYRLEEGAIKRFKGDIPGSIFSFQKVSDDYERWFGVHLKSQKKISEEFLATLGSAEWKPYKTRIFDRVMLRYYQALNYLQVGDQGRARAEIFKIRQSVADSKEIWKKELIIATEQMKKKGIELGKGLGDSKGSSLEKEFQNIKSFVPEKFPSFVNPAAMYLEALYFLSVGSQREDFEKASYTLRQLASIYPNNQWIREDYKAAISFNLKTKPSTYIFFETGRAPVRIEKRFDLPVMYFMSTSRIPYLGIAMPSLSFNQQFISDLKISTSDTNAFFYTKMLADFDIIIAQEFEKCYPLELARAISSSMAKGGIQYLTTNSIRSESEILKSAVGVGVGLLAQATTNADLRSWSTLPKQIRFCKIPTPPNMKLTIQGVGTKFIKVINLKPVQTNLINIRSISSHSGLNMINQIAIAR